MPDAALVMKVLGGKLKPPNLLQTVSAIPEKPNQVPYLEQKASPTVS